MKGSILVLGGAGRVGLPLTTALAEAHPEFTFYLVDRNTALLPSLARGEFPYREEGAGVVFSRLVRRKRIVVGEPPEGDLDLILITFDLFSFRGRAPRLNRRVLGDLVRWFERSRNIVITSTLPVSGFLEIQRYLEKKIPGRHLAYCPIRSAEGRIYAELKELPQLASASGPKLARIVKKLFSPPSPEVIFLSPEECALAKLLTNYYRYCHFALANELMWISESFHCDYRRIYYAMKKDYPRLDSLRTPGFSGGPCLPKDTAILISSLPGDLLGRWAQRVHTRTFPEMVVKQILRTVPPPAVVGLLGTAFKAGSDDERGSLTFLLAGILRRKGYQVLLTDEFCQGSDYLPLDEVIERADLLLVMVPHPRYLRLKGKKPVLLPWLEPPRG